MRRSWRDAHRRCHLEFPATEKYGERERAATDGRRMDLTGKSGQIGQALTGFLIRDVSAAIPENRAVWRALLGHVIVVFIRAI